MADELGTRGAAATAGGISTQQLHNIMAGTSRPAALTVAGIAIAAGFDLNWALTGKGPPRLDGSYTPADAMRDTPVDAVRAKLEVRTARKLGAALEKVYKVGDGELPAEIDDTVEETARHIVAIAADEPECLALVRAVAELHADRRRAKR
jgi:hypothetical protein